MKSVKKHIILVLLTLIVSIAYSQKGTIKDEDDLIKRADQLFEKEDFVAAFSLYQTLLSNHEDNSEYNFRYAVCLMYADRSDKTKPIYYLEKALKNPDVDKRLFYFLGMAYQMNYQFTDAIESFEKFKTDAKSSWTAKYNINRRIEECRNGLFLLSEVRGIYVINNIEVKEQSFYRSYETSKSGGKIIVLPDELRTKIDKKLDASTVAFFSNSGIIYFASYGEKNLSGLDIYSTFQNPDGSWAKPEPLSSVINTSYDDAYPYISLDGKTLYFSSKGHNSMGGFDVFRSVYDLSFSSWTQPLNMSFPLNTPFDEIMFLPDS
ncbi:MAG: PD40 domain-containing protein, partial [Bacteroidales bacterium]|nr:PD40 domain-containing protein [Bacteroidales bacterium]